MLSSRDALIRSQIERYASAGDTDTKSDAHTSTSTTNTTNSKGETPYMLVARVVNVGLALLVYARDEQIGVRVRDVQTQWTGCGPLWMGNKGAVGVRFRLDGMEEGGVGETFT